MSLSSQVRRQLQGMAEPGYAAFSASLIPGVQAMLGVRLPRLRALCDCVALAPERALPLIGEDPPPPVIRRMLLQKARDSKRVPPDVLARLQSLPAAREETGGKEAKDFGKTV